jgi:hypothetical protein
LTPGKYPKEYTQYAKLFISADNEYVTSDVRSRVAENVRRSEVSVQRRDSNELSAEGIGRFDAGRRFGVKDTVAALMKKL